MLNGIAGHEGGSVGIKPRNDVVFAQIMMLYREGYISRAYAKSMMKLYVPKAAHPIVWTRDEPERRQNALAA